LLNYKTFRQVFNFLSLFFSCRISPFISIIEDATCCLSAPDENHVIVWCRRWTSSFLFVFYDGNLKLHFSPCFLFAYVLQSLCFSLYYKRVIIQFFIWSFSIYYVYLFYLRKEILILITGWFCIHMHVKQFPRRLFIDPLTRCPERKITSSRARESPQYW